MTIAGGAISTTGGISVVGADINGRDTHGGTGSLSGTGVVRANGGMLTISENIAGATGLQVGGTSNTLALAAP